MILDPQVGDVVFYDPLYLHLYKHGRLLGTEHWVVTSVKRRIIVSVATLHKVNGKHTKSYSGIPSNYLIRNDFLSAVNRATKGKQSAA